MASFTKNNAGSINSNLTQEYVDWLPSQSLPNSKGPMGQTEANAIHASRPEMEHIYQNQFLEHKMKNLENYVATGSIKSEEDIGRAFGSMKGGINNPQGGSMNQVQTMAANEGFGGSFQIDSNKKGEVLESINLSNDKLDDISDKITKEGNGFEDKIKGASIWKPNPGIKL
jgi:hypothetical protein